MNFKPVKRVLGKLTKKNINEIFVSKKYWEERYRTKGTSGPGSYGRLAQYKANFLNDFVQKKGIKKIIDLGCGDGSQLELGNYGSYVGLDVSLKAIEICRTKFEGDATKSFFHIESIESDKLEGDLVISLDVIYHLVEDEVFKEYMELLFSLSSAYVIIYSSNFDKEIANHVRCRKFTKWIEAEKIPFKLILHEKNPFPFLGELPNDTSMSEFFVYKRI